MARPQPSRRRRDLLYVYITLIIVGGGAMLLLNLPRIPAAQWPSAIVFLILVLAAESAPIDLPNGRGTVSIGFWIIYATTLVWGTGAAAWAAAIGSIRLPELRGKISLEKVLFNRGQLALAAGLGGMVYQAMGGVPGTIDVSAAKIPALAACGLVYFLVNLTSVVLAMTLAEGVRMYEMWLTNFKWVIPQYLLLTPLAILLAHIHLQLGLVWAVVFCISLFVARYSIQLYNDMREDYLSTISALIDAVEAKDPYTRGHSESVRRHTVAIGTEMGLRADALERLEYASLLHDIGKIGIDQSILRKPGRLTDEEYAEIKAHPVIGGNIVQGLRLLGQEAGTVRHHHEWIDGRGYPDGLIGDEIPIGARIIAVADAYDAMTSDRPYRRTFSRQEALAELRRCSGTQFDPDVVEAFVRALEKQESAQQPQ